MPSVVINTRTGATGSYAEWVAEFAERWAGGRKNLDRFMDLLSPDIRLIAPGLRPTQGWDACHKAFQRTFEILPDLTAEVTRWSASGDVLFIEMTFAATVGRKKLRWNNVDRLLFREGRAIERVAYFDPSRVRRAFLRSPRGLWQLLRLRLGW